jgi:branched-subunit amino acid transport protein
MGELRGWTLLVIAGMTAITVLTRCGFSSATATCSCRAGCGAACLRADRRADGGHRPRHRHARRPLGAALEQRPGLGALVTAGWCFWRRNDRQALTVSIVVGLVVYLVLRVGFGL